jgi:hypothetical protein
VTADPQEETMRTRPLSWFVATLGLGAMLGGAPAFAEVSYGKAQGGLRVGGQRVDLAHAAALHVNSVFEGRGQGKEMETVVVLSDREVDRALVGDVERLAAAARQGGFHAVEVRIQDSTGEVLSQRLFRPGSGGPAEALGNDSALWLRGEYTNKEIWGAVGSDGELATPDGGKWRYEAFFAALFPEPRAAGLAEGKASGTLELDGKAISLEHARAYLEETDEEERTYTVLVLSSAPVDLATARADKALAAAARKGAFTALKLWIHDQEGTITRQLWVTPGETTEPDSAEGARWAAWEFTDDSIRGFVTSDGERGAGPARFSYDVHFAAPIEK